MLRELEKDEKVLGLGGNFTKGEMLTIIKHTSPNYYQCSNGEKENSKARQHLLAIGDKVACGPDLHRDCQIIPEGKYDGKVGTVKEFHEDSDRIVEVSWEGEAYHGHYRMTPDHQDLKPMGDSEDGKPEEEGKPECFGKYPCPDYACNAGCPSYKINTSGHCRCTACKHQHHDCTPVKETKEPKPIKEEVMTREQRAVKKDKEKEQVEAEMQTAIEEHNDMLAQKKERIAELAAEAHVLRDFDTDRKYHIDLIKKAKNLDGNICTADERAEAMLALKSEGIEV